jgi:hypothetical protein
LLPCEERGLDLPQVVHQLAVEPAHQLAILVQTKIQQPIGRSGGTGVEPRRCSVEAQAFLQPPASAPPRRGVLPASRRRGVWPHHASGPSPKVTRPSVYQGPDCWRRDRVAFSAGCRTGRTRRHVRAEQTCLAGGIVNQRFERAVGFGCKRHGAGQNDSFAFCFSSLGEKNWTFSAPQNLDAENSGARRFLLYFAGVGPKSAPGNPHAQPLHLKINTLTAAAPNTSLAEKHLTVVLENEATASPY